jgi:hypothetical protein
MLKPIGIHGGNFIIMFTLIMTLDNIKIFFGYSFCGKSFNIIFNIFNLKTSFGVTLKERAICRLQTP